MKKAYSIERRDFLRNSVLALGSGFAFAGAGLWGRRAYAVEEFKRKLLTDSQGEMTQKAHHELTAIPMKAREEIRTWFHGKCLNVSPFVDEISSRSFRRKLRLCQSEEDQHAMLMVAFNRKVATDVEITNRVRTIAEEIGQELDSAWGRCCLSIASRWDVHVREYAQSIDFDEFLNRTEQTVRDQLTDVVKQAWASDQKPTLGETVGKTGESALLLLPMYRIRVGPTEVDFNPGALIFGVPTFIFLAFRNLFQYITGQLIDSRSDLQYSISSRVALLGNRVGAEFETESRSRIAELHTWQETAVDRAAHHYANRAVGWF